MAMTPGKTLREREKELQVLLPTPAGKLQLEQLAAKYSAECGRQMVQGTSLITYILVYERDQGFISV